MGIEPYYQDSHVTIYCGACESVLEGITASSVEAVVTDPPYGIGFMSKSWDSSVPRVEVWQAVLDVLKPGGHLLSFAGTRTQHRMAVNIEDAGFEIRDLIAWCYGSGFAKGHDISKAIDRQAGAERESIPNPLAAKQTSSIKTNAFGDYNAVTHITPFPATEEAKKWDGWNSALKPAFEPITMARKPLDGTLADNTLTHGCGGLNIDACRVELNGDYKCRSNGRPSLTGLPDGYDPVQANQPDTMGRWPANFIHDGSDEVLDIFPDTVSGGGPKSGTSRTKVNTYGDPTVSTSESYGVNSGSAARFFYCAKASKSDRGANNNHPTVKPLDLMKYLVRLVTPDGGVVLDPYMGSGTTLVAAKEQGFRAIGIEMNEEYCKIAIERLRQGVLFGLLALAQFSEIFSGWGCV